MRLEEGDTIKTKREYFVYDKIIKHHYKDFVIYNICSIFNHRFDLIDVKANRVFNIDKGSAKYSKVLLIEKNKFHG